jgi:hypothetical protein
VVNDHVAGEAIGKPPDAEAADTETEYVTPPANDAEGVNVAVRDASS